MPELPEVETIRRGLAERLVGLTIDEVDVRLPKQVSGDASTLEGRTISEIRRHGKLLVFILDDGKAFTVHLKMTGQLIWRGPNGDAVMGGHPNEGYLQPQAHKHTRTVIDFTDGSTLFFNDMRTFGNLAVLTEAAVAELPFVRALGPEPLEGGFTARYLAERIALRPKTVIKSFLLDQTNLAGLGNIYADESLFRAAVLPMRAAGDLTPSEVKNLHAAIQETLELALKYGGSSERDYVDAVGAKGTYLAVANAYHRTGLECNRCGDGVIARIVIGGRSTHFCPECQR